MDFVIVNTFIFWVACSLIVGAYSRSKGGSFFSGFIVAILISPLLAALILAVRRPQKDILEQRELAEGRMKKCPHCAELIRPEAIKCRFCSEAVS